MLKVHCSVIFFIVLYFSEQEIMDVISDSAENNTLLKRDTVFAQMNFCLKSGLFKLVTEEKEKVKSSESSPGMMT